MNTHFKVFASYNILQYLGDFIHVLVFVIVSKCRKNPKLTNIVINFLPLIDSNWKKEDRLDGLLSKAMSLII